MKPNQTETRRGSTSGPVPYTGPRYTVHGREIAGTGPALEVETPARPVRPCC